jgi:Rod binding domain-containing protein
MSLAPPTDLVLEVSRAADPERAAAVVEKLKALSAQGAAGSPGDFAAALNASAPSVSALSIPATTPAAHALPADGADKAKTKLESALLSQFIGEMLPKDAPSAFGQGYAGDMWRSMLAERVADQISASGRLGIASKLFASHPIAASAHLMSPEKMRGMPQAQTSQTSDNALSAPSGADVVDGAYLWAKRS